jgi:hypothetical protein
MAKKRRFAVGRSDVLYKWKMYRLYAGTAPESIVSEVVNGMSNRWASRFGLFNAYWDLFVRNGHVAGFTPADRAKLRALLNYVLGVYLRYGTISGFEDDIMSLGTNRLGLTEQTVNKVVNFVTGLMIKVKERA